MAINRYRGNTGQVERVQERSDATPVGIRAPEPAQTVPPPPAHRPSLFENIRPPRLLGGESRGGLGLLDGLESSLGGILSKITDLQLDTEDLILVLIIWLMYKESEDEDLLIVLAALIFL